jgi:signal recognition particle subunit SRP54
MSEARKGGYDVVMLDTAGRLHIDEELLAEAASVRDIAKPKETLLVADALTGQDAVNLARAFDEKIGITGIVLTRIDGDGRGGAALSMRAVTGKPIKLMGTGEKLDGLEDFHPERIAGRILGMGDVVSLVEKAALDIDQEKAKKIAERMRKGAFDMNDLADQLKQLEKLGGMGGVMKMLPGMGKIKKQIEGANLDNKVFKRQMAIIGSMTPASAATPRSSTASARSASPQAPAPRWRNQQAPQDAPADGRHDEADGPGKGMFGKMMGGKGMPSEPNWKPCRRNSPTWTRMPAAGSPRPDEGRRGRGNGRRIVRTRTNARPLETAGPRRPETPRTGRTSAACRVWAAIPSRALPGLGKKKVNQSVSDH